MGVGLSSFHARMFGLVLAGNCCTSCALIAGLEDRVVGDAGPDANERIANYRMLVTNDHPVAYWHLDDASTGTAVDSGPHGYNGTYMGTVDSVPGVFGASDLAAALNGSDGSIQMGDVIDFKDNAKFTLEAWVKPDVPQKFQYP